MFLGFETGFLFYWGTGFFWQWFLQIGSVQRKTNIIFWFQNE